MTKFCGQVRHSGMAALALTMLAGVMLLAGMAIPAQAQPANHPAAFFPYPSTFPINGILNNGDLLGVPTAAVGDFNGDGNLDIVSIAGGEWEIDVALGNGDGTFQYPITNSYSMPTDTSPYAIAVGDFNGDGNLDLAVWCTYAPGGYNEVAIFLGNGNGTFTYRNIYTAPNAYGNPGSNSLYVADFNGKGKLDLAALAPYCASNLPCVAVYLGNGDGTFQAPVLYSTIDPNHPNNINAYGMAVGELGTSGKPDIAVTQSNGVVVLLNNGNGTFGTAAYYDDGIGNPSEVGVAIGQVRTGKKNDIVITSYRYGDVILYENQGSGTFVLTGSVGQAPGGGGSWLVSMADINGGGKQDLVVTDMAGEIWTFFGKGNGTFTPGAVYPLQRPDDKSPSNVILADFNNDGVLDIFIAGTQWWLGDVTLGRSDGTFQTNAAYGWNDNGYGRNVVTADFNGDGYPDVAYSYARNSTLTQEGFEVALGSSHGVLGAPTFVEVAGSCGGFTEWIAAGDVNGDGKPDIVSTVDNSTNTGCPNNQVAVSLGTGTGKFKKAVYYSTGASAQSYDVFLEDLRGNGLLDIVTSNADGTISVLLNQGKGTYKTGTLITSVAALSPYRNSLAFGDFNGDGKLDIAVSTYGLSASPYNTNVYVLLGNGDGTFQAPIITNAAPTYTAYAYSLASGDFNNDGNLDLFVVLGGNLSCSPYGGWGYVFLAGNGAGGFTPGPVICAANEAYWSYTPVYPVVADFNADGNLDVFIPVLQQGNGAGPTLLEGNGNGTFTPLAGYEVKDPNLGTAWLGSGFYVGQTSYGAAVADFNGDGTPDIAVLNANDYYNVDYVSFVTVLFNDTLPVSVSPINQNSGTVAVGSKKAETILVTNDELSTLDISSVTVSGADPGDFPAKSACGKSLKAGFECLITVTFTPAATGARTATLNINDSAGTQTVQLTGTGK